MELFLLADRPEAIPVLARWYYAQWGYEVPENSVVKEEEKLTQFLNRDKLPLSLVAYEGSNLIGGAQLKFYEMSIYPEKEHWLGAVYVAPEFRGRGIAAKMIKRILELAKHYQVPNLYLQTEHLDGGLYARMGWEPEEQVIYEGVEVLVMKKPLL
ncbi:MAG: GNAT family N-acetyltransferase [Bacteroidota bacterium]